MKAKGGRAVSEKGVGGDSGGGRWGGTFRWAVAGAVLLWAALPPVDWGPVAFVAPIPWVLLVRRRQLAGRRPYARLWLAGCLFWLAALHWLRLPHWLTTFGWIAMGIYMGIYLPAFVGLARVAVHRLRVPVWVAAPVVWAGIELVQGHALTGFTMGGLGHTQYRWIPFIQVSDLAGVYGVGFAVMFIAACLGRAIPAGGERFTWRPLLPAAAMLAGVLAYGQIRLATGETAPVVRIGLIQGSVDSVLVPEPGNRERMHLEYYRLTQDLFDNPRTGKLDLIVWPETVFFGPLVRGLAAGPGSRPGGGDVPAHRRAMEGRDRVAREQMVRMAQEFRTPMLVGIDRKEFGPRGVRNFNSAVWVDRSGQVAGWYDKMHLVVFGEYIPFVDRFSWLIRVTPLNRLQITLQPGAEPVAFALDGLWIAPNICYESVLPHLIRGQVKRLTRRGREPDILVNLTNDGWFWGSSELDMHLACGVFRAVECRKPFLIAANTGFSAWIDGSGRIRARGPRRATGTLVADVAPDGRTSWYLRYGDVPAGLCLAACVVFAAVGVADRWWGWRARRSEGAAGGSSVGREGG